MNEFRFSCGKCGQHLKAEADCVNLVITCPMCGVRVRIPRPEGSAGEGVPVGAEVTEPAAPAAPAPAPEDAFVAPSSPPSPQPQPDAPPSAAAGRGLSPALLWGGLAIVLLAGGGAVWFWKPWLGGETILPPVTPPLSDAATTLATEPAPSVAPEASGVPEPVDPGVLRGLANDFIGTLQRGDAAAARALITQDADPDVLARLFQFLQTSGATGAELQFQTGDPRINGAQARVPVTIKTDAGPASLNLDVRAEPAGWRVAGIRLQGPPRSPGAPAPPEMRFAFARPDTPVAAKTPSGSNGSSAVGRPRGLLMNALGFAVKQGIQALNRPGRKSAKEHPSPATAGGESRPAGDGGAQAPTGVSGSWIVDFGAQPADVHAALELQMERLGLAVSPSIYTALSGQPVKLPARRGTRLELIEEIGRQIGWKPVYAGCQLKFERGRRKEPVAFAGPFMLEITQVSPTTAFGTVELTVRLTGVGIPEGLRRDWEQAGLRLEGLHAETAAGEELFDPGAEVGRESKTTRGGPLVFEQEVGLHRAWRSVDRIAVFRAELALPGLKPPGDRLRFELHDLPLKPGPDTPDSARPLVFEGDVPVTAKVIATIPGDPYHRARVEVRNLADRPLRRLVLKLVFLDPAGEPLGSTVQTQAGSSRLPGPRKRRILERVALPGRPEGTARVRAEVQVAEFSDGTQWKRASGGESR